MTGVRFHVFDDEGLVLVVRVCTDTTGFAGWGDGDELAGGFAAEGAEEEELGVARGRRVLGSETGEG